MRTWLPGYSEDVPRGGKSNKKPGKCETIKNFNGILNLSKCSSSQACKGQKGWNTPISLNGRWALGGFVSSSQIQGDIKQAEKSEGLASDSGGLIGR